jgi:preprotein translocase subunit SecG
MILIILPQNAEGGALGMGGNSSGNFMTTRGRATAISRITWILGALFLLTSLSLNLLSSQTSEKRSLITEDVYNDENSIPEESLSPAIADDFVPIPDAGL